MTADAGALSHSLSVTDLATWVRRSAALIAEHAEELTDLDAAIGDADHGTNMKRGLAAAAEAVQAGSFASADALLKKVGTTLVSTVGGASGPLYGTFFLRAGGAVAGLEVLDARALAGALAAIAAVGGTEPLLVPVDTLVTPTMLRDALAGAPPAPFVCIVQDGQPQPLFARVSTTLLPRPLARFTQVG